MRICELCINLGTKNYCYLKDKTIMANVEGEFCEDYLSKDDMLKTKELRAELNIINSLELHIGDDVSLNTSQNVDDLQKEGFETLDHEESSDIELIIDKLDKGINIILEDETKVECNSCKHLYCNFYCNALKYNILNTYYLRVCSNYENKLEK